METCVLCGEEAVVVRRGDHDYSAETGLSITLRGVELHECGACGDRGVGIPRLAQLHRLIATHIARRPRRLTPAQIRFARKWLGLSGQDFARRMRVDAATVSRWENGRKPMGATAEQLLRLLVLTCEPVAGYSAEDLPAEITSEEMDDRVELFADEDGWRAA